MRYSVVLIAFVIQLRATSNLYTEIANWVTSLSRICYIYLSETYSHSLRNQVFTCKKTTIAGYMNGYMGNYIQHRTITQLLIRFLFKSVSWQLRVSCHTYALYTSWIIIIRQTYTNKSFSIVFISVTMYSNYSWSPSIMVPILSGRPKVMSPFHLPPESCKNIKICQKIDGDRFHIWWPLWGCCWFIEVVTVDGPVYSRSIFFAFFQKFIRLCFAHLR